MKTPLILLSTTAFLFSCRTTAPVEASSLASVQVTVSSTLVAGVDYDEVQVQTRLKDASGTYENWALAKDFTAVTKTSNLSDPVKVTPATYRFNMTLLKSGNKVAYGSETDSACLVHDVALVAGNNPNISVVMCTASTTGPAPTNAQPVNGGNGAAIVATGTVVNGSGTAAQAATNPPAVNPPATNPPATTPPAPSTSGTTATATGSGGYPMCIANDYVSNPASPGWGWSTDATFCNSNAVTKPLYAAAQSAGTALGCSCQIPGGN